MHLILQVGISDPKKNRLDWGQFGRSQTRDHIKLSSGRENLETYPRNWMRFGKDGKGNGEMFWGSLLETMCSQITWSEVEQSCLFCWTSWCKHSIFQEASYIFIRARNMDYILLHPCYILPWPMGHPETQNLAVFFSTIEYTACSVVYLVLELIRSLDWFQSSNVLCCMTMQPRLWLGTMWSRGDPWDEVPSCWVNNKVAFVHTLEAEHPKIMRQAFSNDSIHWAQCI